MQTRLQIFGLVGIICLAACVTAEGQTDKSKNEIARATDVYLRDAEAFFIRYDYKHAIPLYQKALELQKKQTTLDKNRWRVLVDHLGQAYGISGDLKKAKATFAYGLKLDPKYWAFHYSMACTYAEMNDADQAIFHLQQTFENKQKSIKYPDPWTDRSFQGLMGNDKFVKALREIDIH